MGPQEVPGPGRCFMVADDISRRERSPTAPGGYSSARTPRFQSSSSLFQELTAGPAGDDGAAEEFTRLTHSNLARYQLYLSRTEDSASSIEEVVRTRSGRTLRMRPTRCRLQERPRKKRHVLQSMARPLKKWLIRHRDKPYPSKAEKLALAMGSHMTLEQVSNWFANARRRLKNTVYVPGMNWGDRIRQYNNFISGNTEPLSISSDDSIWDSDCEQRVDGCPDEKGSLAQGARRECQPRAELFEHSYSSNVLHKGNGLHAAATATPPRGAPKRVRCTDGETGPGGKRPRPSCDSDSPSENDDEEEDSDDDSTTVGPADEPQPPHPPPQRRSTAAAPSAPSSCSVKRRLFDSADSSPPAFKKYKTSMLLRYIGADERRQSPGGGGASQATSRQPRPPNIKRPREEQQPAAARTADPKRAAKEGQRPAAKKRKCTVEPTSALRWTEIEAAEALTHLSQSSALCWSQQPQQQRVA